MFNIALYHAVMEKREKRQRQTMMAAYHQQYFFVVAVVIASQFVEVSLQGHYTVTDPF